MKYLTMIAALATLATALYSQEPPKVNDDRLDLELFCKEPSIATPIGVTFDAKGRLLVIESHTHKRDSNYKGPKTDRILIVEDTNTDGVADRFRVFFEGTESTMSLLRGEDGWIYVATRMKIFRIRDTNGDDKADEQQPIVHLETKGNYPHNGLSGLAFDNEKRLLFGIGENLGADYRLVAADDSAQSGSGEGGIFRCSNTGENLTRLATGLWNPFGICVDKHDRIFAVGNDPDGSPPCRLIHVVETGDYGFQFKYGRSGRHPLQAWNGELPGTLPMIEGTGEAPCEIMIHHGRLYVASWGHNRIERYELLPVGASFQARREIVVQGDANFRPVGFAKAPDGSLYFTDWVDRSYPVHGKGRIWRLSWKEDPPTDELPPLSAAEKQARKAALHADWNALKTNDRFLHSSAVAGIAESADLKATRFSELSDARQRAGYLQAMRWQLDHSRADKLPVPTELLQQALADKDGDVRLLAIRWAADANVKDLRDDIEGQLSRANTTELFLASLAAIEWLDTGKSTFDPKKAGQYVLPIVTDDTQPTAIRVQALRLIPPDHSVLTDEFFGKLLTDRNVTFRREVIRTLATSANASKSKLLETLFSDTSLNDSLRADAVIGLNMNDNEALLKQLAGGSGAVAFQAHYAISQNADRRFEKHPAVTDTQRWIDLVGEGGDSVAGWRIFFQPGAARCANCHRLQGRGAHVGPDLTSIGKRTSRLRVLQSILQPSRDVAPQFVPSIIETTDGKLLQGLSQGYDDKANVERFLAADGSMFQLAPNEIERRSMAKVSIMPADIHKSLTIEEIQNLLALLEK